MMTLDGLHLAMGLLVKPALLLALMLPIAAKSYVFSAARHGAMLNAALLGLILMLVCHFCFKGWDFKVLPEVLVHLSVPLLTSKEAFAVSSQNLVVAILVGYVFIALWLLSYRIMGIFDVLRLLRTAKRCDAPSIHVLVAKLLPKRAYAPRVVMVAQLSSPAVFGYWRPLLLLPAGFESWPVDRQERVLIHELAHLARADWITKLLSQCMTALFWLVPPLWWLERKIAWYAELACDDAVIARTGQRTAYAQDLMDVESGQIHSRWLMALMQASGLYARIEHLLDARQHREPVSKTHLAGQVVLASVFAIILGLLHLRPMVLPDAPLQVIVDWALLGGSQVAPAHGEGVQTTQDSVLNLDQIKYLAVERYRATEAVEELHVIGSRLAKRRGNRAEENSSALAAKAIAQPDTLTDAEFSALDSALNIVQPNVSVEGFIPQSLVTPQYPKSALRQRISGRITMVFDINVEGRVENIRTQKAAPAGIFDETVKQALSQSQYLPMRVGNDKIRAVNVTQTYVFQF